jgi:hypothetical protein
LRTLAHATVAVTSGSTMSCARDRNLAESQGETGRCTEDRTETAEEQTTDDRPK